MKFLEFIKISWLVLGASLSFFVTVMLIKDQEKVSGYALLFTCSMFSLHVAAIIQILKNKS
jgi:hypothetical protein